MCDLDLALPWWAAHCEVDAKSQPIVGGVGGWVPGQPQLEEMCEGHVPWGLFSLDSFAGSAMGAEPVTCAQTLRWVTLPFRTGMKPLARLPSWANWDVAEKKGRNKLNREILLPT